MEIDEYKTIVRAGEGTYTELRSKFLGFAHPVETVEQAMEIVAETKRRFYDARHVAYAYMIGKSEPQFRANDDGEPSGTAGKPILGQLRSRELTDTLVTVVRYFGGVKLGTSRLGEAYREAAVQAIENAGSETRQILETIVVRFSYEKMNSVMRTLRDAEARILENTYDEACRITVSIRQMKAAALREQLLKIDTAKVE